MPGNAFTDEDVQITAHLLIKQHGADATALARSKAEAFARANKRDGYAMWRRILLAVQATVNATRSAK